MIIPKHGGDTFGREIRYDFSANLNPLGIPQSVKKALENSIPDWERYPDPYCRRLKKKLSERENFPPENIVCGNGAADLIFRIVQAVKPNKAVICAPSFGEYTKALEQCGCEISAYQLAEEKGFALDGGIITILDKSVDMLILCTPNNPTGRTIESGLLREICRKCEEDNIIFLCDECFIDFVVNGMGAECFMNKNVVVLKAFTKIYAMAGLRLGYALFGSDALAEKVRETGQFWSVSSPAQVAGEAALDEQGYAAKTAELIKTEREYLSENLLQLGLKVYPSEANFILFYTDMPLDEMLLRQNILIRNCENFNGISRGFFRIAVRTHEENTALISALGRCING